ncbi:MAG: metal-dependent transcriptional regulator [Bacteriovoracales bacterium]|nr:metal-dependent transcriptional regulator [Bacteriovoracales bacterium]
MKDRVLTHTQDHELSHSMAHYLLTIHKLKEKKGYARVTDIAKDLGLTKGSVSTALNSLRKRQLIGDEDDSKFLLLTPQGHREVHNILSSRTLLYYFLRDFLCVGDDSAHKDSCLMEHLMSSETREKLFDFMKSFTLEDAQGPMERLERLRKNIGLDFQRYKNYDEFLEDQKGDSYLK